MKYELAQQLKDAGFPQRQGCSACLYNTAFNGMDENVYLPSLSELINACGENFGCLQYNQTFWQANHTTKSIEGIGDTSEEAVAKLWLELNK